MNKDILKMMNIHYQKILKYLFYQTQWIHVDRKEDLLKINHQDLTIRVSIDHYQKEKHEEIRGKNTFNVMMEGLKWLNQNNFNYALATRLLWGEQEDQLRDNFNLFIDKYNLKLDAKSKEQLVTFAEMDEKVDTPEITTACWNLLGKNPDDIMCSSSRMVVKKKTFTKTKRYSLHITSLR